MEEKEKHIILGSDFNSSPNNSYANLYLKFFLLAFVIVMFGVVSVSAIQQPSGWWNVSTNMAIASNSNITNEVNYTDGNLTISTGGDITIYNSDLNFTIGRIFSGSNQDYLLNISSSTIRGLTPNSADNRIYLLRGPDVYFEDSYFKSLNEIRFEGLSSSLSDIRIRNSYLQDFVGQLYFNKGFTGTILDSNNFSNMTYSSEESIKFRGTYNYNFTNNYLSDFGDAGIGLDLGSINTTINYNVFNNIKSIPIVISSSNNTIVIGNNATNYGWNTGNNGYCIDGVDETNGLLIENNICINGSTGITISLTDLSNSGGGVILRNNKIINMTRIGYGIAISNLESGGFISENDYIDNALLRGISLRTSNNVTVTNLTMKNNKALDLLVDQIINVTINNLTIENNAPNTFDIVNSSNILISNSLIDSNEDYFGQFYTDVSYNVNFSNVLGWRFYFQNVTDLEFNISSERMYYKSDGSTTNIIQQNSLTSALAYNTNGSVLCGGLATGNCNITLPPGNASYVLDSYVLNESNERTASPLNFTSSTSFEKTLGSSLVDNVTVPVSFVVDHCDITSLTYTPESGSQVSPSYTCANDMVLTNVNVTSLSTNNQFLLTYQFPDTVNGFCQNVLDGYESFGPFIPVFFALLGIVVLIGIVSMIIFAINNPETLSNINVDNLNLDLVKAVFLGIFVIGLIIVVALVTMTQLCATA